MIPGPDRAAQAVTGGNDPVPSDAATHDAPLPAGDFSSWLRDLRNAMRTDTGIDVPCGDCVGCCSSSYFIHIRPEETGTLNRIPKGIVFAAPGLPGGHMLLGYDRKGLCPMLKKSQCTIYTDRPQTCRQYDCRIFTAAGIAAGGPDKVVINGRVERWVFSYPTERDRAEHLAVRAAAAFIREHASSFPGGRIPDTPSELAIAAIKAYEVFLVAERPGGVDGASERARSDAASAAAVADAVVHACRRFDETDSPA